MYPSAGPVRLKTNLADSAFTKALKDGAVSSPLVSFEFAGPKTANQGFKPMVRESVFEAGELALVTYLQAKSYGKPYVLLPVPIVSRFQHHTIGFAPKFGQLSPKDIEGKRVGVRTYSQTTGLWVRGILQHDFGVDLSGITWVTAEDGHLAEYEDPANCVRKPEGETIDGLLLKGEVSAAILGDTLPEGVSPLIPEPHDVARAWQARTGMFPINHMFVVREELSRERPDVVREIYRVIAESNAAAPEAARKESAPFGVEANRKAIQTAIDWSLEQKLIPRRLEVDELFDDVTRVLGA
ncbi:MAG: phosphate transporter substrate-binding protein [Hyphomicrobiales bacterium]|nr:phosphate transporter substrate-binding protein [Hyphomicrobiales bacterium]